ncbi:Uu.00g068330.m01.CDS01 [Anthostomella pinea]|uniref:Uu.00g068330.m01.CDS01 n=1 Tax=Anthostomella pinea TaxID=933095 RepID=A0AAI8YNF5_9PEZI|nr:Uu.00g068330.m01.CDS01 [Anthostomella pinea]
MLPGFLRDSYKQYKDDTDWFATWLVNVAKRSPQDPGSNVELSAAADNKYATTVSQLLAHGKAVAKSAIDVPASVLARARRAIKLRNDVTSHYLGKGDVASNRRHAHFVLVLEEICELLEWKTSKEKKDGKQPPPTDAQAWLNRFAALTVEEAEDIPESIAAATSKDIVKVEVVEEENTEEGRDAHLSEAYFRLLCLFHDLENWRAFISQTWTEYRDLKIDLMTASVVTDNALQLARDLINEVVDRWPHELPGGQMSLQELLYENACLARGVIEPPSTELGMTFNEKMADVADWAYVPTATLLNSFVPVMQKDTLPGCFGTYDPQADRANMNAPEKFNEDKLILLELLPGFCVVEMFNVPIPVKDEITRGFVEFARDKQVSLWLCFAAQILLDTYHIMRRSRLSAFDDLRMSGLRIARVIEDFWKLSKTHPQPRFWPKEGDEEIKRIRDCVSTFIEQDSLQPIRRAAAQEISHDLSEHPDHLLFSRNPVLSGTLMMHLNLRMQTVGQGLVTQWYDVQQLAFLYNLAQQVPGGPKLVWPDIEVFIKIHSESRIFVGDRPKDASQSLNRLEIATGISSAARFACNSRHRGGAFHRPDTDGSQNARALQPTTKVANLFRPLYMSGDSSRVISHASVEKLLDELSAEATAKTGKPKKGKKAAKELVLSAKPQQLLGRKWSNTHNIGPLQLLALIKSKLSEEEPVILFNYFGMHKRAVELLRLIRDKEHHKFSQYFTAGYMPDESMISNIVILVHHVARGSAMSGQQLGLASGRGSQVVSRIVVSCRDVMSAYLKKNGDAACRELRTFCKNKAQVKVLMGSGDDLRDRDADESFGYWFGLEEVLGPTAMASLVTGIPAA